MSYKTALVCGVSGQDGSYLARLLVQKGYSVIGTSRDAISCSFENLRRLGIRDLVQCESMVPTDLRSVMQTLEKIQPDEIYNFSGQSSLGLSFKIPVETIESHVLGTLNLLEGVRALGLKSRLFNASSGECFGDVGGEQACNESTPFNPRSPYAVAKSSAFWEVASYRESYDLYACSGILFNHESHLRSLNFVSRKITHGIASIKLDLQVEIVLGNLDAKRDWGHAEDYVQAMWLMLQQELPDDYVVSSGSANSVRFFVASAFESVGLFIKWDGEGVNETGVDQNGVVRVRVSEKFFRPVDLDILLGDPSKAENELGWRRKYTFESMARNMVNEDLACIGRL